MKPFISIILALAISVCTAAAHAVATPGDDAAAPDQRNKLIGQLLDASGLRTSLQYLTMQAATGLMQAAIQGGATKDEAKEFVGTLEQAFPQDVFVNRVRAELEKNYDAQRYGHVLQLLSAPLPQRIVKLEGQPPNPAELKAFLTQATTHPLTAARIELIQDMDAVTRSNREAANILIASMEAGVLAGAGDCSSAADKAIRQIEMNRPAIEKASRPGTQVMLAFLYRDVSDADLSAYLKINEDKDNQWLQGIAQAAVDAQYKTSIDNGAQGLKKIIQAHKPRKTMFAPKCGQSVSPGEDDHPDMRVATPTAATAENTGQASTASPSEMVADGSPHATKARHHHPGERDLVHCLDLPTNAEIIACTEK